MQFLLKVVTNGLPFAIRIGCEIDFFYIPRGLLELGQKLLLAVDNLIVRFKAILDIDRQIPLGKVLDMTE